MLRYLDLFLEESREHLVAAYELQARLESASADRGVWRELMRHAHSLKGMAAAMGYRSMVALAHALEDQFDGLGVAEPARVARTLPLIGESLTVLGGIVDRVERGEPDACPRAEELAQRLREAAEVPATPAVARARPVALLPSGSPPREPEAACWRVEIEPGRGPSRSARRTVEILRSLAGLGRVVGAAPPRVAPETGRFTGRIEVLLRSPRTRAELLQALSAIDGVDSATLDPAPWGADSDRRAAPAPRWVRVRDDRLDALLAGLLELRTVQRRLQARLRDQPPELRALLERSTLALREVHRTLTELRLVPFDSLARRLQQAVRELASELGKEVAFAIEGARIGVDRRVLDALAEPLLHAVRNALDHGLEPPAERLAAGKPSRGTLRLGLERRSERVRIAVEDDGRGIDSDALKRRARELQLVDEGELERMGRREALMLTTLSGFTTARRISHISGRGIGLDVVRDRIERLGGAIELDSQPGVGTRLVLTVPASLALVQALLVRCSGELFAVPLDAVAATRALDQTGEADLGNVRLLRIDPRAGPRSASRPPGPDGFALLLGPTEAPAAALLVDEVLGRHDVLVQPLHAPLGALREYSGAALIDDGTIVLVVDPSELLSAS